MLASIRVRISVMAKPDLRQPMHHHRATTLAFAGVSIGGLFDELPGSAGGDLGRHQGHFLAALGAARLLVLSCATTLSKNFHRGKREQGGRLCEILQEVTLSEIERDECSFFLCELTSFSLFFFCLHHYDIRWSACRRFLGRRFSPISLRPSRGRPPFGPTLAGGGSKRAPKRRWTPIMRAWSRCSCAFRGLAFASTPSASVFGVLDKSMISTAYTCKGAKKEPH